MKFLRKILVFLLFACFGSLFGQTKTQYNIETAYQYARERNPEIRIADLRIENMINNVNIVQFRYYPNILLSANPMSWNSFERTTNVGRPTAKTKSEEVLEPMGSITLREHLPTNSDITLRWSRSINNLGEKLDGITARFDQEIIKLDQVDKAMTLAIQKRELQRVAKTSVERSFLNDFRKAYYDYLQANEILTVVLEKRKEDATLRELSRRQYEAGIIAEYNLLDYLIDFNDAESEQINADANYRSSRNNLFHQMRIDPDSTTEFETVKIDAAVDMVWNIDEMLKSAIEYNLDIANFKDAIVTSELNLKYLFDDYLPSLKAYVGYDEQQKRNDYNNNDTDSTNYYAGLQLTWNLFADQFTTTYQRMSERNTQRISQMQLDDRVRWYKNKILNDVTNLERYYADYLIAFNREAYAKRDFDLANERMKIGTISAWDMIRTKNRYFQSVRSTITRKYTFLKHISDMLMNYPMNDEISRKYAVLSSKDYFVNKAKEAMEEAKTKAKNKGE